MSVASATLARWYAQLASALEAGLTLERAVGAMGGPPAALREEFRGRLLAGDPLDEALARGASWLPAIDRQLIEAGAHAGRVPEMLRRLARRHEEAAASRRQALAASLYPALVAHFAVVAIPIRLLVLEPDLAAYAWAVLKILIPAWILVAAFVVAFRRRFAPAVAVVDGLPWIRAHRRARALADLTAVLAAQVDAGLRLDVAWLQAALASGDRRLEPLAIEVAEAVQQGRAVSSVITGRPELPSPFAEFWATGEETGRLAENLAHLHRHFADLASRALATAAFAYPKILFGLVTIWVATQVVGFYAGYFRQIQEMMGGG